MAYTNHQALKWLKAGKRGREIKNKRIKKKRYNHPELHESTGRTRPCLYEACVSIFKMRRPSCLGLLPLDGAGEDY